MNNNFKEIYEQYKDVIDESLIGRIRNTTSNDLESEVDSMFEYEKRLIDIITDPDRLGPNHYYIKGQVDGCVDFVELDCEREYNDNAPNYMRKYQDIEDCLIFDKQMSKSKPIRPVKIHYLKMLRYWYKGHGQTIGINGGWDNNGESNLGKVEVWIGEWNKRQGMSSGHSLCYLFKNFDKDAQRRILEYVQHLTGRE